MGQPSPPIKCRDCGLHHPGHACPGAIGRPRCRIPGLAGQLVDAAIMQLSLSDAPTEVTITKVRSGATWAVVVKTRELKE